MIVVVNEMLNKRRLKTLCPINLTDFHLLNGKFQKEDFVTYHFKTYYWSPTEIVLIAYRNFSLSQQSMLLQGKILPRLEYSIQPQSKHLAVGRCSYFMEMSDTKVPITRRGGNI